METILFFVGLFVGVGLTMLIRRNPKPSGTFVMDFTDPLKDVCRLELSEDINTIYQKKQIVLTIQSVGVESQN